ncbi:Uncharacterized protein APZ42_015582 [Daphnia magna]|uniref:Uncharacterized protein n=1 Tax=Daphnia magna TaxID=35525 RepID=A0A162NV24_9CRUS|nr:Uncharacterized protein APZ42_015582 [Daphnia magna]
MRIHSTIRRTGGQSCGLTVRVSPCRDVASLPFCTDTRCPPHHCPMHFRRLFSSAALIFNHTADFATRHRQSTHRESSQRAFAESPQRAIFLSAKERKISNQQRKGPKQKDIVYVLEAWSCVGAVCSCA